MSDNNPFGGENPFASVQKVTQSSQATQNSLADYNPFADTNVTTRPAATFPISTPAAAVNNSSALPTFQPPPAPEALPSYTPSAAQQQQRTLSDLERQQQELDRRAAELDRREKLAAQQSSGGSGQPKNFPPLPVWCPNPLKPCFYQDISLEIPVEFQKWVRILFYLWSFHSLTLAFNILTALVVWIGVSRPTPFWFAILYFVLFTPASYICWFRPAYKAFRSDSSMNFMLFFFIFFCQCVVSILEALGFTDSGFCGLLLLIYVLEQASSAGRVLASIFVFITTLCFIVIAGLDVMLLLKIHRLYRNTGASFEKAQAEFATNVMSNKNVQNAATTVITESARSAMQRPAGGAGGRF